MKYMCIEVRPFWPEVAARNNTTHPQVGDIVTCYKRDTCECGCDEVMIWIHEHGPQGYSELCFARLDSNIDELAIATEREAVGV